MTLRAFLIGLAAVALIAAITPYNDFDVGNKMARRIAETDGIGLNKEWAWCWPVNRRILYNRASVDLAG